MRLLEWNSGDKPPPYAILSHTWGPADKEVVFKDFESNTAKGKPGYDKILFCGTQAQADHGKFKYFWIDTCCMNKENASELQESLNSMFKYFSATPVPWEAAFRSSRWFARGWTL
ncbi:hypothetical protein BX600DRAFT_553456 [Xylariales sp. PMI_506]|nr:hypothetical protein BX600DRAFT_553456 [Xylariales sp. PMI_506]